MVSRKLLASTFGALSLGVVALASSPASASPYWTPYPKYWGGPYGGGYVAAGVLGGMALGAMAASGGGYASNCYLVRRKIHTPYGLLIRKVRVCE
jgi:hypothetical protein